MQLKTSAIILNWQRADLTLACMASLAALEGALPDIYVVDNHSGDDSVPRIREAITLLAKAQPQRFREIQGQANASLGDTDHHDPRARLTLIESSRNLGFGGGVNLGLRAALKDPSTRLFWILNNDTQVTPTALHALRQAFAQDPRLGIVGSSLCYLNLPETLQGVGGRYDPWLGTTAHVLGGYPYSESLASAYRPAIDYVVGAAACVRREVLTEAGLFPEDYFLYFEDLDWAFSVRKHAPHWQIGYALESRVFHQEGASTGAHQSEGKTTTLMADYYYQRNRLRFARRWYPARYPLVHLSQLLVLFNRIRRRQWHLAGIALGLFLGWVPGPLRPRSLET
jgi:GT2 family glycosyltransferase